MSRPSSPVLVVLAAGLGSRYGGPKQLDRLGPGGELLLEYAAFDAWRTGFSAVVLVVREELEAALRERIGEGIGRHLPVHWVRQEVDRLPGVSGPVPGRVKPWGTGHAVLCCREAVGGRPFCVANADDYYGREPFAVLARRLREPGPEGPPEHYLVSYPLEVTLSRHGPVSRGVCTVDGDGHLLAVRERTRIAVTPEGPVAEGDGSRLRLSPAAPVSTNLWGFRAALFPALDDDFHAFLEHHRHDPGAEHFLPVFVDRLLARGSARVRVLPEGRTWLGVTYPEDRPRVVEALAELSRQGLYPEPLWG